MDKVIEIHRMVEEDGVRKVRREMVILANFERIREKEGGKCQFVSTRQGIGLRDKGEVFCSLETYDEVRELITRACCIVPKCARFEPWNKL